MTIATVPRGVVVLCVAALTLTGCGGGGSSTSNSSASTSSAASSSPSSPPSSTAPSTSASTESSSVAPSTPVSTSASAAASGKPFTVTMPAGYKAVPSRASGSVVAFYAGPVVGKFTVNVNITQDPSGGASVQSAQRQAVAGLKRVLKISKLSSVTALKLDGESALSYSFEDTQNGLLLKQGQIVLVHGAFVYVITFTSPVAQFTSQSTKAVQLIKSLRFR